MNYDSNSYLGDNDSEGENSENSSGSESLSYSIDRGGDIDFTIQLTSQSIFFAEE